MLRRLVSPRCPYRFKISHKYLFPRPFTSLSNENKQQKSIGTKTNPKWEKPHSIHPDLSALSSSSANVLGPEIDDIIPAQKPKIMGVHYLKKDPIQDKWVPPSLSEESANMGTLRLGDEIPTFNAPKIVKASSPYSDDGTTKVDAEAESVTVKGAVLNCFLATSKLITGLLANSPAMISDSAHSFADIATDAVTFVTYRVSRQSANWEFAYGYGKVESLGAVFVGGVLVLTGGAVGFHSIDSIMHVTQEGFHSLTALESVVHPMYAAAMAVVSMLSKEMMYQQTFAAGERSNSAVLKANAYHHRSDALSSAVALVGIGGGILLDFHLLDPLAGLVVAGLVAKSGYDVIEEPLHELLDKTVSLENIALMRQICLNIPGVKIYGANAIRARKTGPHILADIKITVDGNLSASSAHQLGEHVRFAVMREMPDCREVRVHVDPDIRQEFDTLHDRLLEPPVIIEKKIRSTLLFHIHEINFIPNISLQYTYDGKLLVKVSLSLDPELTIKDASEIAHACRAVLLKKRDIERVHVDLDLDLEGTWAEEERKKIFSLRMVKLQR